MREKTTTQVIGQTQVVVVILMPLSLEVPTETHRWRLIGRIRMRKE